MKIYDFNTQLQQGLAGELVIDKIIMLRPNVKEIISASQKEQLSGIDRIIITKSGKRITLEYKSDRRAATTGNGFVEIWHEYKMGHSKAGWALKCAANFLLYYIDNIGPIYIFKSSDLKTLAQSEWSKFQERTVANNDFQTRGLIVPLDEFKKHSIDIWNV